MSERTDQLKSLLQNGQIDRAIEIVQSVDDYHDGESNVFTVLGEEKSTPELVEAVLESFLSTKPDHAGGRMSGGGHGGWVHSLSHFTGILWERRMDKWIKKFNEVSLKGANELGDTNCSDRLVGDFGQYAKFDDDPAEFSLTFNNLRWMDWKYAAYSKARVEAGPFASEEEFLRWKLHRPETHIAFDFDAQTDLINIKGIRALVQKLQELGADTSEFNGLERSLLTRRLGELEEKLPAVTQDWERERLEKGIQKTRAALSSAQ
ncbi:MAG: hypothetical protein QG665_168 [Patescibacteria group bacterium]|nr:hypothetical protein [Patescibacteria group bacterium]